MPTTFIEYKDEKGFYISEEFMQLAIYFIYEELKKTQYSFLNKNLFDLDSEVIIDGVTSGYLTLSWNRILVDSSEELMMLEVLQNVKNSLQNKGVYITVAELQAIPTIDNDFKRLFSRKPFPIAELIKIIDALMKMLLGTWDSNNYGMAINYKY